MLVLVKVEVKGRQTHSGIQIPYASLSELRACDVQYSPLQRYVANVTFFKSQKWNKYVQFPDICMNIF